MRYVCCDPTNFFDPGGNGSSASISTLPTIRATTSRGRLLNSFNAELFQLILKEAIALQLRQDLFVRQRRLFAPLCDGGEVFDVLHQLVELLDGEEHTNLRAGGVRHVLNAKLFQSDHSTFSGNAQIASP